MNGDGLFEKIMSISEFPFGELCGITPPLAVFAETCQRVLRLLWFQPQRFPHMQALRTTLIFMKVMN